MEPNKEEVIVDFNQKKQRQEQHANGGGSTIAERLARLETRIQYLATEAYIERRVNWLVLVILGAIGIATAIIIAWLDK